MTLICRHHCDELPPNQRVSVDRTLAPYDDGLKFCGICLSWFITSKEVLNKVFPEIDLTLLNTDTSKANYNYERRFILNQIIDNHFIKSPLKCPCCGNPKLREKPKRHKKRSDAAFRYEAEGEGYEPV